MEWIYVFTFAMHVMFCLSWLVCQYNYSELVRGFVFRTRETD